MDVADVEDEDGQDEFHWRYSFSYTKQVLTLRLLLKPGVDVRKVLELAEEILGHSPPRAHTMVLPRAGALNRAVIKSDIIMMLWSQHSCKKGKAGAAVLYADATEKKHRSFFCQRIETLVIPPDLSRAERASLDTSRSIEWSLLPVLVVGHGEGDLPHQVPMALHVAKLMAGSGPELFTWRCSFRGCCPDQGVDMGIIGAPYVDEMDPSQ